MFKISGCKDIGIRNLSLWEKLNSFDHSENNNVENVWVDHDSIKKNTSAVDSIIVNTLLTLLLHIFNILV